MAKPFGSTCGTWWRARCCRARTVLLVTGELAILLLWTLLVTRPYLNTDPAVVPGGRDFVNNTLGHHVWLHARHCGLCALWNGDIQGGAPALVDSLSATLHPVVIVGTLLFGVVNGAKAAIVASFFMAGVGQWALARVLGLTRPARLWSAAMVVTAGHLFGAMSGGLFPIVTSIAATTLLTAALVKMTRAGSRRLTALAGVLIALLIVSGQGYLQIAFALTWPLFAILLIGQPERLRAFLRELGLAGMLGALLSAPFLVPFLHFYPQYSKQLQDPLRSAQPFGNTILNLVIDDPAFYHTESLHKLAFPEWYINFIGWPAAVLAIAGGWILWWRGERRLAAFLAIYALAVMWLSTATIFQWFFTHRGLSSELADFGGGIRTASLMAKLAASPILALAAVAIDWLCRLPSGRLSFAMEDDGRIETNRFGTTVRPRLIVSVIAIVLLLQLRAVGQSWMPTERYQTADIQAGLAPLRTPNLEWVQPPFGEPQWIITAIEMGMKLSFYHRPWDWRTGEDPPPKLVASRGDEPGLTWLTRVGDISYYKAPSGRDYAAVT